MEKDKEHAMKQLQKQYRNKHHHLYQTYIQNKGRPRDVVPEDWNWLIHNKWNDYKFQVRLLSLYIYILNLNFIFYNIKLFLFLYL